MKKFLYLAFILIGMGILSACGKLDDNDSIIGSWRVGTDLSSYTTLGDVWTFEERSDIKESLGEGWGILKNGKGEHAYHYDAKTKILTVLGMRDFYVEILRVAGGTPEMSLKDPEDHTYSYASLYKL